MAQTPTRMATVTRMTTVFPPSLFLAEGEIRGTVYVDHNNNGLIDMGELAIQDVVIVLTGTDIAGNPVNLSTMSGPDGTYSFLNLLPGDYIITQTHPTDYIDGQETLGDGGGSSSNDQFMVTLNLANNFMANGYNFGELGLNPNAVGKSAFLASAGGSSVPSPLTNSGELAESVVFLITGPRLDVIATSSDDTIEVHAGLQTHRILVNHVAYDFSASEITQIEIQAGEGSDTVVLHGTSIADRADIWPGLVHVYSDRYAINVTSADEISVYGERGRDVAILVDSSGNDIFLAASAFASMRDTAGSYFNRAYGFSLLTGNAVMGGADRAVIYDTYGNDFAEAMPAFTRLQMGVVDLRASQFERVEVGTSREGSTASSSLIVRVMTSLWLGPPPVIWPATVFATRRTVSNLLPPFRQKAGSIRPLFTTAWRRPFCSS